MKTRFCFLLLSAIGFSAFQKLQAQSELVTPALPSIPNKIFNITTYGAVGNNTTDNTAAIQNAINAAKDVGGGKVILPAGVFMCGPLQFTSNLNLQLDAGAILKFLPIDKYP